MAIRFVDVGSGQGEDAGSPPPRPARRPEAAPEPAAQPAEPVRSWQAEAPAGNDAPLPGLPHAKPEPKPRGRKKPMSAAGPEKPRATDSAPLLDGLLPELQAHAKPIPKPRGRKKAFG